jgi:hypothetical protein
VRVRQVSVPRLVWTSFHTQGWHLLPATDKAWSLHRPIYTFDLIVLET